MTRELKLMTFRDKAGLEIESFDPYLEPQTTIYKWLFQLDDSKSLYRKWLFHQTSIYEWLFGVPGSSREDFCSTPPNEQCWDSFTLVVFFIGMNYYPIIWGIQKDPEK